GYDSSALASSAPSVEIATPLTPDVPTSSPTSTSGAKCRVDELVGADGVLRLLRLAQCRLVDPRRDAVDEAPLQDRALDGADRVLRVGVEVEAEALAVRSVAGAAELERELDGLHEGGCADHVVVVERAPARVRVLVS